MKMKTQRLNYDISFYASIDFISSDLRCNLILIIYIYIYLFVQILLQTTGSHFGYPFYQTFNALP